MGSELGISEAKILDLPNYASSSLYSEFEKVALEYADRITNTQLEVSDAFFARLESFFESDEIVELTATIAWENCSSKFNRALRVGSQELWQRGRS